MGESPLSPETYASSSSSSSHSRQTHSPTGFGYALSSAGTIVTPQRGQMGGRSSSDLLHLVFVLEQRIRWIAAASRAVVERDRDQLDPVAVDLEDVEAHPVVLDVVARLADTA